ncbi:hypothetical protein [Tabrizicola sp. TH137]|uniref:hypothetical protein n=1 Tax=Tabrizicola sp. TH137 TaxID=2067452 RepID=UPI00117FB918|nr:hypothetical protein [Tabrizicola sp. TH137]
MSSTETPETEAGKAAGDDVSDGIRRALEAAAVANDAAQDLSDLSAAHRKFAEAVIAGQRRNTMIASGALAGSVIAVALGGLVYFRSVADLRLAAAVQSEAAALLVEEVKQIDGIGDRVDEQQAKMAGDLLALLEQVKDEIRIAGAEALKLPETEPVDPAAIAETVQAGLKTELDTRHAEVMEALAEIKVDGIGANMDELRALIAEMKARGTAAAAEAAGATARPAAAPAPAAQTGAARNTRPAARAASAPEPNPFVYP